MSDFSWNDPIYLMIIASLLSVDEDKIEELKKQWNEYKDDILSNYNIITAPKTIKLSEIVNRLKERLEKHLQDDYMKVLIERDETKRFITLHYEENLHGTKFKKHIVSFWNNDSIGMPENTNFKWLYTLWIAGTIVEDDLQEE